MNQAKFKTKILSKTIKFIATLKFIYIKYFLSHIKRRAVFEKLQYFTIYKDSQTK